MSGWEGVVLRKTISQSITHTHTHKESYFEVKAGYNGQLFHGQLLGGLLVTMATTTLDLRTAAEVLWSGEPRKERVNFRVGVFWVCAPNSVLRWRWGCVFFLLFF